MVPLVDNWGYGTSVRLESVLDLANAHRGAIKFVGIILDQGREMVPFEIA